MITKFYQILCAVCVVCGFAACVDNDDDVPTNYYTSTKMTAAQFLENNNDRVGEFVQLMKRTPYFSLLSTYGNFTVFAPTDAAVEKFLSGMGLQSVDELDPLVCDTLVRMHIVKEGAYFTTDIGEGSLPSMNMADSWIELKLDSDVMNNNAILYYVNNTSRMVEYDDSVTNGVVHIVNGFLKRSNEKLPDIIEKDSCCKIFYEALRLTGMADSLMYYEDETYKWGSDKLSQDSVFNGIKVRCKSDVLDEVPCKWPEHRYFKYTAFVEPDSVLAQSPYNIHSVNDLIAYAKQIYDASFPADAGKYDSDFKHRKNPLNRFISYHLLDRELPYDQIIMSKQLTDHWALDDWDPEEFYETMSPGCIMRFAAPDFKELYINRKGIKDSYTIRGVKVVESTGDASGDTEHRASNGRYYYLDDVLAYSQEVREDVLNCRIRFDGNVLSPDFQNSGARGRYGKQEMVGLRSNYIKNWKVMGKNAMVGLHGDMPTWNSYKGNAININGIYDVTIKLPPVPSGTYELRTGYTVGAERGVVQFYLLEDDMEEPCGIPVDLRVYGGDPNIGFKDDVINKVTNKRDVLACRAIDKAMRSHGYMKAMNCYMNGTETFRDHSWNLRRILTTRYFDENKTYYLRCRQVLEDDKLYWNFDYLELCPKSVYANPEGEDWN